VKGSFAYFSEGPRPTLLLRGRHGGPARTLPGGPTGRRFDLPTSIDLYGRRLAVAWRFSGRLDAPGSEILLVDTRRRTKRVVDRIVGGGLTSITREAPAFDSGRLYWARLCQGDPGGCPGRAALVRYRYAASGPAQTAPIGRHDLWQARGGGVTWLLRDDSPFRLCRQVGGPAPAATCRIFASGARYR